MQIVINTFGTSLRRQGKVFRILCNSQHTDIAAAKVDSILITTGAHFSTDALELAYEHNIDVVLLDKYGEPYGRFWLPRMGSTATIRRKQLECATSDAGLEIVREWTVTKLQNQQTFLRELGKRRPQRKDDFDKVIDRLDTQIKKLTELTGSVEEQRQSILGAEGSAGVGYWQIIGTLPPKNFQFTKRSKHPAEDPFNAMLNYAYGVLYSEVERACIIAGLDPFVGFMHTDNYNKYSLVYDLIEPFRIWADRTVTKLFTGRRCKEEMFDIRKNEINLGKKAKELLLSEFNSYLDDRVRYKVKAGTKYKTRQIRRRACVQAEAHTLANRLLGKEGGLPQILETKEVFDENDNS
ncbi:MAG: CRISPR-associated endonuclease Cas1 [Verrucomicrobiota bacterium]